MTDTPFRGIYTAIYRVPDVAAAKTWYAGAFGVEPYFDEPFYVGFDVGGFELGLQPLEGESAGLGGVVAYWGVADAEAAVARLTGAGATIHSALQEVGGGIKVATVKDPWGNPIGVIENPHFKR